MANKVVKVGTQFVGEGMPCWITAEIGINHNGDLTMARNLISESKRINCDSVKFQKRTVEVVYKEEELNLPRVNPFGPTNGDLKRGLEFNLKEYEAINYHCKSENIQWFASCWDEDSVDFIEQFNPVCYKIASASLTDDNLLKHHRQYGRPIILSTGMSTIEQIDHAVEVLGAEELILLHCTSTYPAKHQELNLRVIQTLRERYEVPIGYSGHEVGLASCVAAYTLGACMIERHITLDRAMWGSDQAASVGVQGFGRLIRYIKGTEEALGDGVKKVYDSELPIINKLRRVS